MVRAIGFQYFQPTWSWSTNVTDRRRDDMRSQDRALHYSASRGKNESKIIIHWWKIIFRSASRNRWIKIPVVSVVSYKYSACCYCCCCCRCYLLYYIIEASLSFRVQSSVFFDRGSSCLDGEYCTAMQVIITLAANSYLKLASFCYRSVYTDGRPCA